MLVAALLLRKISTHLVVDAALHKLLLVQTLVPCLDHFRGGERVDKIDAHDAEVRYVWLRQAQNEMVMSGLALPLTHGIA